MILFSLLSPTARSQNGIRPSDNSDAVTIEGTVTRNSDGSLSVDYMNQNFELKSVKRPCQDDLNNLQTGDHLVGLGRVQSIKKLIWLDEVELVGIYRVLGEWNDPTKHKRFDFQDFTRLDISDFARHRGQSLNYRLVPDKKDEWTIFLSNDNSVKVGTMKYMGASTEGKSLQTERLRIELVDLKSSKISEQYDLTSIPQK